MTQNAISVKNLTAGYGRRIVLENISFDVPPGQILTILGGSGCGKRCFPSAKPIGTGNAPIAGRLCACPTERAAIWFAARNVGRISTSGSEDMFFQKAAFALMRKSGFSNLDKAEKSKRGLAKPPAGRYNRKK